MKQVKLSRLDCLNRIVPAIHVNSVYAISHVAVSAFCLVLIVLGAQSVSLPQVQAQTSEFDWSRPVSLSMSSGYHSNPRIVADRYGHLHVFWIENPAQNRDQHSNVPEAIFYTNWDGSQWSMPTDILIAPSAGPIAGFSVVLDDTDQFQLVLVDGRNRAFYYTSANLTMAHRAMSWTNPRVLSYGRVGSSTIAHADGDLYVAYTLAEEPFEVCFVRSNDHGLAWSEAVLVSDAQKVAEIANDVGLTTGPDGVIYVVWARYTLPDGYPPLRISHSRSTDEGESWTEPVDLQEGHYGLPIIVVTPENLSYITYNGAAGVGGRYFHLFLGDGHTWSDRITIASGVGGLTGGAMAVDSAGTLHYASASHLGGINGIAYAQWNGNWWSPLINIAETFTPSTDQDIRQGYEPHMTISEGNRIHVVYLGADHSDVFYVTAQSAAPAMALSNLPTEQAPSPRIEPTPTASATPESAMDLRSLPPQDHSLEAKNREPGPVFPIWTGALPAVLLVGAVVVFRLMRRDLQ